MIRKGWPLKEAEVEGAPVLVKTEMFRDGSEWVHAYSLVRDSKHPDRFYLKHSDSLLSERYLAYPYAKFPKMGEKETLAFYKKILLAMVSPDLVKEERFADGSWTWTMGNVRWQMIGRDPILPPWVNTQKKEQRNDD